MSEAGLRRPSAVSDEILNENTGSLMVGMPVWVDGTKHGRIAYIGEVHFAKGEMAGVHLDTSQGKNNGTVGGVMYFQCEPKRGVFSRLHRLTLRPISG
jgi:dynactin complex subunit